MIKIVRNLYIDVDKYNYKLTLDTNKIDKNGNPIFQTISYHSTLKSALNSALNYINRTDLEMRDYTLEEAIKTLNDNYHSIFEELKRIREEIEND